LPCDVAGVESATEARLGFTSEDFASIVEISYAAIMTKPVPKQWRAKLISILFTRLTLENWRAKLISLLLAIMVWYLIKKNVATSLAPPDGPSSTPITETR